MIALNATEPLVVSSGMSCKQVSQRATNISELTGLFIWTLISDRRSEYGNAPSRASAKVIRPTDVIHIYE